jgi:hypothetical protein
MVKTVIDYSFFKQKKIIFDETAYSLIGHTISGAYKTVSKIIGTVMKILASMTLDKQYQQDRQIRINRTIKNLKEGIEIGFRNLL